MSDSTPIRRAIAVAILVGSGFAAWDMYLFCTRTVAMAPVGFWRLAFSLSLQLFSVFGFSSFAFPATSRIRRVQDSIFRGGALFPALFGLGLGAGFAIGALHYSNCSSWGLSGGSHCTPYP